MGVCHLKVMILRNSFAVSDPGADDMSGKPFGKFGLPRRAEIVEQPRSGRQTGAANDAVQLWPI